MRNQHKEKQIRKQNKCQKKNLFSSLFKKKLKSSLIFIVEGLKQRRNEDCFNIFIY